jgi:hypothetical protein
LSVSAVVGGYVASSCLAFLGWLHPGVLSVFRGEGIYVGFKDILLCVREQQVITVRLILRSESEQGREMVYKKVYI